MKLHNSNISLYLCSSSLHADFFNIVVGVDVMIKGEVKLTHPLCQSLKQYLLLLREALAFKGVSVLVQNFPRKLKTFLNNSDVAFVATLETSCSVLNAQQATAREPQTKVTTSRDKWKLDNRRLSGISITREQPNPLCRDRVFIVLILKSNL